MDEYEDAYLKAEAFISSPPKELYVLEIKPQKPLQTTILGSSEQSIVADYKHGFELGMQFINEHKIQAYLQ